MQLDSQTISIIIAASSVIIGVIFSVASIAFSARNASRSRQAQIFMRFHGVVSEKSFLEDFQQVITQWSWDSAEDYIQKFGISTNPDAYNTFVRITTHFDSMGTLVRNKLTDIKFMPRGIAIMVTSFWDKFKPIAPELERLWGNTDVFGEIEFLYGKINESKISVAKK